MRAKVRAESERGGERKKGEERKAEERSAEWRGAAEESAGSFLLQLQLYKEKFSRGFSVLYPGLQNIRIDACKTYRSGFLQTSVEGWAQGREGPTVFGTDPDKGKIPGFFFNTAYFAAKSMKSNISLSVKIYKNMQSFSFTYGRR